MSVNAVVGCYLIEYACYHVLVLGRIESGGKIGLKMVLEPKNLVFEVLVQGNPVTHLGESVPI